MGVYLFAGMNCRTTPDASRACVLWITFQSVCWGTSNNPVRTNGMSLNMDHSQDPTADRVSSKTTSDFARKISNQAPGLWRRGHGRYRLRSICTLMHSDARLLVLHSHISSCPPLCESDSRFPWAFAYCFFSQPCTVRFACTIQPIFATQLAILNSITLEVSPLNTRQNNMSFSIWRGT